MRKRKLASAAEQRCGRGLAVLLQCRNGPGERPASRLEAGDAGRACEHVSDAWTNGDTPCSRCSPNRSRMLVSRELSSLLRQCSQHDSGTGWRHHALRELYWRVLVAGRAACFGPPTRHPARVCGGSAPPRAVAAGQSHEHAARGVPEYTCCVYQRGGLAMVVQVASLEGARRACWACTWQEIHTKMMEMGMLVSTVVGTQRLPIGYSAAPSDLLDSAGHRWL